MATVAAIAGSSLSVVSLRARPGFGFGNQRMNSSRQPTRTASFPLVRAQLSAPSLTEEQVKLGGSALAGAVFAALASSDSALAAQQVMELAANDNRGAALLIPLVPAVAWILYNILQPALNQLSTMRSAKGLAFGVGLGAAMSLLCVSHASAAQEIAQVADSDSRGLVLIGVLVPAIAWVLFNILQPALSQLRKMRSSKALIGGLGLGAATMLHSPKADAAIQEIASVADTDSRGLLLLVVLIPAIGWVLFNILQPALKQLSNMRSKK